MQLLIQNPALVEAAQRLADRTGEPWEQALLEAATERMQHLEQRTERERLEQEILELVEELAAYPVADTRPADKIIGYDEHGLPH